jgi:putative FmdB family regulatory protein
MPTYDYECEKCGHKFEHFQKMSDEPLRKCPECGKKVHRLIGGGTGIIFKGSGFYETDYRKRDKPKPEGSCPAPKSDGCKGCSLNKDKK